MTFQIKENRSVKSKIQLYPRLRGLYCTLICLCYPKFYEIVALSLASMKDALQTQRNDSNFVVLNNACVIFFHYTFNKIAFCSSEKSIYKVDVRPDNRCVSIFQLE